MEHGGWGWHTAPETNLCAVLFSPDGIAWSPDALPPDHPSGPVPYDLAFELTTTDIPPDAGAQLDSVDARQDDVDQRELGDPLGHRGLSLRRGVADPHLVPGVGEHVLEASTG